MHGKANIGIESSISDPKKFFVCIENWRESVSNVSGKTIPESIDTKQMWNFE